MVSLKKEEKKEKNKDQSRRTTGYILGGLAAGAAACFAISIARNKKSDSSPNERKAGFLDKTPFLYRAWGKLKN